MTDFLFFVVESHRDALILSKLVAPCMEPHAPRIYATHGTTALASLARSLLIEHGGRVMVVENAETLSPERCEEFREPSLYLMKAAGDKSKCDLFSFLPSIASIFFEAPEILANVDVPESRRWKDTRLHAQPYEELQEFLGDLPIETWVKSLPQTAWTTLREGKQAKALIAAVEQLLSAVVPPKDWPQIDTGYGSGVENPD